MNNGESSNGRTAAFEAVNEGSTPSSPVERNYHMEWYERNREKRVAQVAARRKRKQAEARVFTINYLVIHPCIDCGETDIVVLEFDHVRGVKKKGLAAMVSEGYALKSIQEEIDKCEVVCANCHRRRTARQGGYYRTMEQIL